MAQNILGDWDSQQHQGMAWDWDFLSRWESVLAASQPTQHWAILSQQETVDGTLSPTVSVMIPSHLTSSFHSSHIATEPSAMWQVELGAHIVPRTPSLGPPRH